MGIRKLHAMIVQRGGEFFMDPCADI